MPAVPTTHHGVRPGGAILGDRARATVARAQPEAVVGRQDADVRRGQAEDAERAHDRAVRLVGDVRDAGAELGAGRAERGEARRPSRR